MHQRSVKPLRGHLKSTARPEMVTTPLPGPLVVLQELLHVSVDVATAEHHLQLRLLRAELLVTPMMMMMVMMMMMN